MTIALLTLVVGWQLPDVETAKKQTSRPVACFVNCEPMPLDGFVVAGQGHFRDADGHRPRVLVCVHVNGVWYYEALKPEATEAEMQARVEWIRARAPRPAAVAARPVVQAYYAPASRGGC